VDPSLLTRWTSPRGWGGKLGDLVECFDKAAVRRATTDLTAEFEGGGQHRSVRMLPLREGLREGCKVRPIGSADSAMLWLAEPRPPQGPFGKYLGEFILLDCGTN
jgi:hypothetical protein